MVNGVLKVSWTCPFTLRVKATPSLLELKAAVLLAVKVKLIGGLGAELDHCNTGAQYPIGVLQAGSPPPVVG